MLCLFGLFLLLEASAQQVRFLVNDGISDQRLISAIENNLTHFLTSINVAAAAKTRPVLADIPMSADASGSFLLLWDNMPFRVEEDAIVERVLRTYGGYQVRNVPITLTQDQNVYQELVIDLNNKGDITRVNLALPNQLYLKVIPNGAEVSDLRHRQMILDYVEQFRTSYNRKDIDFLEKVFSDDALIITGRVVKKKAGDRSVVLKDQQEIQYTRHQKKEYLDRLKNKVFPQAEYIRVHFSDIKVTRHPTLDGFYGVMLRQNYESSVYADEGYLFMIWDFRDENRPQIHVRTWQPYWMDDAHTRQLEEKKVFTINDFTLK